MNPELDINVGGWLRERAETHPARTAIRSTGGPSLSFGEFNALTNRCAAWLRKRGISIGDRVALGLGSEPLYLAMYFACAKLGAIFLPLNTRLSPPELEFQLSDAEPHAVILAPGLELNVQPGCSRIERDTLLRELPATATEPEAAPGGEAPQVLMYTSGTTGEPKGALLPHRKTVCNSLNAARFFELRNGDIIIVPVPLFHSFGLKILSVPCLLAGATVVLVDRFDPIGLQETVQRERATLLGGVPVMFQRMLRAGLRGSALDSLRCAFSAGAALDIPTIEAFADAGVSISQGYGQTETSVLCCLRREDGRRKAGSVGQPVGHCEFRIADKDGFRVATGERGEIQVRGDVVMLGYWRRPEDTARSQADGWHRTGDLAVMDNEGFVTLVGRLKEMYISGGENIYPAEVERVLEQHPNVAEVAVLGVPDPEWGESGWAFVVPHAAPFDVDELLRWSQGRLAGYKRPAQVIVREELPRTASGKVQKHRLLG